MQVEDKEVETKKDQSCEEILSQILSKKKLKQVIACKCDQELIDLKLQPPNKCKQIEPVYINSDEGLNILRHSAAHIMAQAVKKNYPSAKIAIGPYIEKGFYYDFDIERSLSPDDLTEIEKTMQEIVEEDLSFTQQTITKEEARKIFLRRNEPYKLELLDEVEEDHVTIYSQGDFVDLCRGPHIPSTSYLKAFKLTSVAGAYWRGDENKPMLQRIYGTAWPSKKELQAYLKQLEEAQKRDHRKLGNQLDLFSFSDEAGPGMPIFHPKGALIRTILEDFETREHLKRGYQLVRGPQMLRQELWRKSGHFENYHENMYFSEIDDQVYGLKPMNCLAHMLIYQSSIRSYRDLPIRYFELGTVHRHEKSGVLHGLLRVRQFTQDDAHIICRPDQLQDEIISILYFIRDIMQIFGFEYSVEISTRPERSIGTDNDWQRAIQALHQALDAVDLDYSICAGEGAFYGPKIDIKLRDALNRYWQCATIQCDFTLPERFDLNYVGKDGKKHRPVILHRVILGAIERFMGILIEHFAGALPTWLTPTQARILTITDEHIEFAQKVDHYLRNSGIRMETDFRNEKLGYKVRESQLAKIPYILVIGDNEVQDNKINVRFRNETNIGPKSLQEVKDLIEDDCQEPFKQGGLSYSFNY